MEVASQLDCDFEHEPDLFVVFLVALHRCFHPNLDPNQQPPLPLDELEAYEVVKQDSSTKMMDRRCLLSLTCLSWQ